MDHDALPGFFLTDEHPFASMTDDEAKSFRTDTKFFLLRKLVHYNMKLTGRIAHSERAENEFVLAVSGGSSWYQFSYKIYKSAIPHFFSSALVDLPRISKLRKRFWILVSNPHMQRFKLLGR